MDQQPSVGRIVHYRPHGTPLQPDGTQVFSSDVCRAAIITAVWEGSVGLCVLNPTGLFFPESCEYDPAAERAGTWHWPERV